MFHEIKLERQSISRYNWFHQHNSRSSRLLATTVVVVYQSYYVSCFVQSNPWQTDTQTISTRSKRIPRTTNLIFMFCNQVFLRIFTPCFLNSWAWITYIQHRLIMHARKEKQHKTAILNFLYGMTYTWLWRSEVLSWSSLNFSPRSNVWRYHKRQKWRNYNRDPVEANNKRNGEVLQEFNKYVQVW